MVKISKTIFMTLGFGLFLISAFLLFEPTNSPTGNFVYTPNLAIINDNNQVSLNSNLEIEFITKGTNDLTITPVGNARIIELRCDNQLMGTKLKYNNYNCDGISFLIVNVASEKLEIELKFGNNIQQAINIAS